MAGSATSPQDLSTIPDYIQRTHGGLLTGLDVDAETGNYTGRSPFFNTGVLEHLADAIDAGSPWEDIEPVDPSEVLETIADAFNNYLGELSNFDTETDWKAFFDCAKTKADEVIGNEVDIDTAVANFEADTLPAFSRAVSTVTGALYQANAAEGSTLINAFAILRRGYLTDSARFRSELERETALNRAGLVFGAAQSMLGMEMNRVAENRIATALEQELGVLTLNAFREQLNESIEYRFKDNKYILDLFPYAGNALAAGFGAPVLPQGPSKLSTALAGAAGLAAQGAQLGSAGGTGGAIAGAGIFGTLGLLGGLL